MTVEGPKTTYYGTVELVDVKVISVEKPAFGISSISPKDGVLSYEGGDVTINMYNQSGTISVEIPEDAQSWLSVSSITQGTNPAITLHADANSQIERSAMIIVKNDNYNYSCDVTISQQSQLTIGTVAEFMAAEPSDRLYGVEGVITAITGGPSMGSYSFKLKDYSGEMIASMLWPVNKPEGINFSKGDIVMLTGTRANNGVVDLMNVTSTSVVHYVKETTIAEFLSKENSKDDYYMVTGTIDEIVNAKWGNLYINDGQGNRLYVYGCYPGYSTSNARIENFLAAANIEVGDVLTMIGYRDTYRDQVELCGGIYYSHYKNGISPVDDEGGKDYGNGNGEIDEYTDLNGSIIGNVYYNIAPANGGYNSAEGCLVVTQPSSEDAFNAEDPFGDDFKGMFTGIILMVQPGSGTVKVEAETSGSMTLMVKVGNNSPIKMTFQNKSTLAIPYSVDRSSYVYIYAGGANATRVGSENALKIYSISWESSASGISDCNTDNQPFGVYSLSGTMVKKDATSLNGLPKGIYIVNGRKMVVK